MPSSAASRSPSASSSGSASSGTGSLGSGSVGPESAGSDSSEEQDSHQLLPQSKESTPTQQISPAPALASDEPNRRKRHDSTKHGDARGAQVGGEQRKNARKSKDKTKRIKGSGGEHRNRSGRDKDWVLDVDALRGRWRHSLGLGTLTVRGNTVMFDNQSLPEYQIEVQPDGSLEMIGWIASDEKSSPETIVWTKDGEGVCKWTLEDDVDLPTHEVDGCNISNVVQGKRSRAPVDYKALHRQILSEELSGRDSFQNEYNSGSEPEAKEVRSASEHTVCNAQDVARCVALFKKWMLSTRTPRHEERLRRRGSVSATLPVKLTGAAQFSFQKEVRPYSARVAHREAGTVISVDVAGRTRFQELHSVLWMERPSVENGSEREPDINGEDASSTRKAHRSSRPAQLAKPFVDPGSSAQAVLSMSSEVKSLTSGVELNALAEPMQAEAPPPEAKKRRLRRAVSEDSGGDGEQPNGTTAPPLPTARAITCSDENIQPCSHPSVDLVGVSTDPSVHTNAMSAWLASAPQAVAAEAERPRDLQDAISRLEASPRPSAHEAAQVLAFLSELHLDSATIVRTKIGLCVNKVKKQYSGDQALVAAAGELVERWKDIWKKDRH